MDFRELRFTRYFLTLKQRYGWGRSEVSIISMAEDSLRLKSIRNPAPEKFRSYCPTVASVLMMSPAHWLMHVGQWSVIRRKLGKPPLF